MGRYSQFYSDDSVSSATTTKTVGKYSQFYKDIDEEEELIKAF